MSSIVYRHGRRGIRRVARNILAKPSVISAQYPTTRVERFLLMVTGVLLPLESYFPAIAGFSIMYIMFSILAGYVILNRPYIVGRIWLQPLFLAAYAMLFLVSLIELSHPYSNIYGIVSIGLMFAAAMFVAALCRDRQALQAAIHGYLIAGFWMSIMLFLTAYGALKGATATNSQEAEHLRAQIFEDTAFNENYMAFISAQGAVVAVGLALTARSPYRRKLYVGIALLCFVAVFLPMSRGGIVIVIATSAIIMLAYGIKRTKTLMLAAFFGIGMLIWVPDAVFSRLTFSTGADGGKMEIRARIYTAGIKYISEYPLTGVGKGNFYRSWGMTTEFVILRRGRLVVLGPHSSYIAATIYWGVTGLLTLSLVVYQAYRCLPRRCGADSLSLCLLGIAVSLFLHSLKSHDLAGKAFSLGLGLLVAARLWIWPHGVVQPALERPLPSHSPQRHRL